VKGILEMPVFSAVPWSSLNKELISLAFGTGWLAIAGARKLVAAKREARLNALGRQSCRTAGSFTIFAIVPACFAVIAAGASLFGEPRRMAEAAQAVMLRDAR
jgi:hypothetical protein